MKKNLENEQIKRMKLLGEKISMEINKTEIRQIDKIIKTKVFLHKIF